MHLLNIFLLCLHVRYLVIELGILVLVPYHMHSPEGILDGVQIRLQHDGKFLQDRPRPRILHLKAGAVDLHDVIVRVQSPS